MRWILLAISLAVGISVPIIELQAQLNTVPVPIQYNQPSTISSTNGAKSTSSSLSFNPVTVPEFLQSLETCSGPVIAHTHELEAMLYPSANDICHFQITVSTTDNNREPIKNTVHCYVPMTILLTMDANILNTSSNEIDENSQGLDQNTDTPSDISQLYTVMDKLDDYCMNQEAQNAFDARRLKYQESVGK